MNHPVRIFSHQENPSDVIRCVGTATNGFLVERRYISKGRLPQRSEGVHELKLPGYDDTPYANCLLRITQYSEVKHQRRLLPTSGQDSRAPAHLPPPLSSPLSLFRKVEKTVCFSSLSVPEALNGCTDPLLQLGRRAA